MVKTRVWRKARRRMRGKKRGRKGERRGREERGGRGEGEGKGRGGEGEEAKGRVLWEKKGQYKGSNMNKDMR